MPGAIACALFSLGWASSSASVLLLSSLCGFFLLCRLPSLGILSLLCSVVPLATGSSSCLPSLILLAMSPISLSLFLSCSSLRSLGGPLVPLWPSVISLSFAPLWILAREVLILVSRVSAPRVWGFWVVYLVFSFQALLLPFLPSRGLLRCRGMLPCMPSASLLSVEFLVALSVSCVQCSFFLLSRFHGYLICPASVSPRRRSLYLLALLFVLFLGLSSLSLAVSFLLLPRLPLRLFLPLLCLSVGASWYACS